MPSATSALALSLLREVGTPLLGNAVQGYLSRPQQPKQFVRDSLSDYSSPDAEPPTDIDEILHQLASTSGTTVPTYSLSCPTERGVLATYDTETNHICFSSPNPAPRVAIHEGIHSVHTLLGLNEKHDTKTLEDFAYVFEEYWAKTHNLSNKLYRCDNCGSPELRMDSMRLCSHCGGTFDYSTNSPWGFVATEAASFGTAGVLVGLTKYLSKR